MYNGPYIWSSGTCHHSRRAVRVHGQWRVTKGSGPVIDGRIRAGMEYGQPYFGDNDQHGNNRRTTALQNHSMDISSHNFRQGQHHSGQKQQLHTRRNNQSNRHSKTNENRLLHANYSQNLYHHQGGLEYITDVKSKSVIHVRVNHWTHHGNISVHWNRQHVQSVPPFSTLAARDSRYYAHSPVHSATKCK